MAAPLSAEALPFLSSLAKSVRRPDRALWLRIALDSLRQATNGRSAVDADFIRDFLAIIEDLDDSSRIGVVQRLASMNSVPRAIWDGILGLGGEAGRLALSRAGIVKREALILALAEPRSAAAVAARADLDEDLMDRLLDLDDPVSRLALAQNPAVKTDGAQFARLAEHSRTEGPGSVLGKTLLDRSPLRAQHAPLFLHATSAQRVQILLAMQRRELGREPFDGPASLQPSILEQLEGFALEGAQHAFAKVLAELLHCEPELAEQIASDPNGEPLAVVLAASGAPNDVSVRILTARDLNDGADKYRRLGALIRLKDALSKSVAKKVVAAMVGHEAPTQEQSKPTKVAASAIADDAARFRNSSARPPLSLPEPAAPAVARRRRALQMVADAKKL